jgi:hypothetical protein
VRGHDAPLDDMPGRLLNGALQAVFALERFLLGRVRMPIGLSLYAVVSAR